MIVNMVISSVSRLLRVAFCLLVIFGGSAHAADLTLYWNANSEPDIPGYRVHYGTASVPYGYTSEVGATTGHHHESQKGVTYTFAVTAFNAAGAESPFSAPTSYTVGSCQGDSAGDPG